MRIVKVMVLVVAIALVPLSVGLVMVKQQQNAKSNLDRSLSSQVSEQRYRFQGVEDQAGSTLKVLSQNSVLELPFIDSNLTAINPNLGKGPSAKTNAERAKVDNALIYLGNNIYHNLISAAGVLDNAGRCPDSGGCRYEDARVAFSSQSGAKRGGENTAQ